MLLLEEWTVRLELPTHSAQDKDIADRLATSTAELARRFETLEVEGKNRC